MIVPLGTQIVTLIDVTGRSGVVLLPKGAVGAVVKAPFDTEHSYRVRLVDGRELSLHRHEFAIRKEFQRSEAGSTQIRLENELPDWRSYIIYSCVVGSRAFGLAHSESDTDRRGVYLPPASLHWSLFGLPEQLEDEESQECYWELRKFLILALKANPNVLECLYTPLVEHMTPIGEKLLEIRSCFLSKLAYQTFNGYVISQFKKLEADIRSKGTPRWKHAMHLIRLLIAGITLLREGFVLVDVGEHRDELLKIGRGELSWDELNAWRLELHAMFKDAFTQTGLPERPGYERANRFLIEARRASLGVQASRPRWGPSKLRPAPLELSETQKEALDRVIARQPFPLLFVTVSGAHLYGFPSIDSDYDLRGVHLLPLEKIVGLDVEQETMQLSGDEDGLEIDLVTHDVRKFINLMLKRNGYVLEQLFSPLVLLSSPAHEQLKELAAGCITRYHSHHYLGFAETQWGLFEKETPKRAKTLLYVYRVLLTGIHLMRTGRIEANLLRLNEAFKLPYISDLIAQKIQSGERSQAPALDPAFHHAEYNRLCALLENERDRSALPETPSARQALDDFLVAIRTEAGFLPGGRVMGGSRDPE